MDFKETVEKIKSMSQIELERLQAETNAIFNSTMVLVEDKDGNIIRIPEAWL